MKLSNTMLSYDDYVKQGKMTVADFIDISAGCGLDAIDLLEYYWVDKEREVREIPGQLKEKGLGIGAFCIGNNFIIESEARKLQIEYVREGIRTASKLGAERLRIFGGYRNNPEELKKDEELGIIIDCIGQVIDYAKENGIKLIIENHGGIPATSGDMLTILKSINSAWLKVNFDIGNFLGTGGQDPMEAAKDLYPYIDFIHAKDLIEIVDGDEEYRSCITGQGIVPVRECLEFFREKGYGGYVSLEYEAWATVESKKGVKQSLEYLKNILGKL